LRTENGTLKQKQGFIGSDLLVADFEGRKSELDTVRAQVASLKARHSRLAAVAAQAPVARYRRDISYHKHVLTTDE
jgi:hypothetical protein